MNSLITFREWEAILNFFRRILANQLVLKPHPFPLQQRDKKRGHISERVFAALEIYFSDCERLALCSLSFGYFISDKRIRQDHGVWTPESPHTKDSSCDVSLYWMS